MRGHLFAIITIYKWFVCNQFIHLLVNEVWKWFINETIYTTPTRHQYTSCPPVSNKAPTNTLLTKMRLHSCGPYQPPLFSHSYKAHIWNPNCLLCLLNQYYHRYYLKSSYILSNLWEKSKPIDLISIVLWAPNSWSKLYDFLVLMMSIRMFFINLEKYVRISRKVK